MRRDVIKRVQKAVRDAIDHHKWIESDTVGVEIITDIAIQISIKNAFEDGDIEIPKERSQFS